MSIPTMPTEDEFMLTEEELTEGKRLEQAATPAPWSGHEDVPKAIVSACEPNMNLLGRDEDNSAIIMSPADHALILWLRNRAAILFEVEQRAHLAEAQRCNGQAFLATVMLERDAAVADRNLLAERVDEIAKAVGVDAQALIEDPSLADMRAMRKDLAAAWEEVRTLRGGWVDPAERSAYVSQISAALWGPFDAEAKAEQIVSMFESWFSNHAGIGMVMRAIQVSGWDVDGSEKAVDYVARLAQERASAQDALRRLEWSTISWYTTPYDGLEPTRSCPACKVVSGSPHASDCFLDLARGKA